MAERLTRAELEALDRLAAATTSEDELRAIAVIVLDEIGVWLQDPACPPAAKRLILQKLRAIHRGTRRRG